MNPHISELVQERILYLFDGDSKEELCGVLVGAPIPEDKSLVFYDVLPVPNSAEDPEACYEVRKSLVLEALGAYSLADVIGYIHTHPRGKKADPSYADVEGIKPGQIGMVFHVATKTLMWYDNEHGFIGKKVLK